MRVYALTDARGFRWVVPVNDDDRIDQRLLDADSPEEAVKMLGEIGDILPKWNRAFEAAGSPQAQRQTMEAFFEYEPGHVVSNLLSSRTAQVQLYQRSEPATYRRPPAACAALQRFEIIWGLIPYPCADFGSRQG